VATFGSHERAFAVSLCSGSKYHFWEGLRMNLKGLLSAPDLTNQEIAVLSTKASFASLLLALTACTTTAPGTDQGLQEGIDRFRIAFNKQDAPGVASVYLPDGKILPPGRPMISETEPICSYWQAAFDFGVSHIAKKPIDIRASGDLAVETSTYTVTIKGQEISGKDTLVWRRGSNNVWNISSDIWNNDK
jgi:ketosteroid isomerase-like protein